MITSVKVIIYTHGEELTTKGSSRFYGKNAKYYLDCADGIVTVSRYTKNTIIEMFDIPGDKIRLISNGVDLEKCQPVSSSRARLVSTKSSPEALIFSVGRLIKRKGFDVAIEAMAIVHRQYSDAQLVIAGEGEKLKELEVRIRELNLGDVVRMAGRLSHHELMSFYQDCDIFLMPNRELENGDTEGFGLVFLEANAFKKPVIGGNAGGAVDAIIHGDTGILVDGNSAGDVADAILKLLGNESLRREMGEKGYQWAVKNDVKYKVEEFLEYCESIDAGV
jgi:phosphatidylinositol alpha-1,6-mannosyltransferase